MKIKRIMNQILKPYKSIIKEIRGNYTDIEVIYGTNFCCYCKPEYDLQIEIPIFEDVLGHNAFYNKMQRRLKEYDIQETFSSEILSFLHEIGHIYTYNKWNDFVYIRATALIENLQSLNFIANSEKLTNWLFEKYFNLALERNADKWAMEYIKTHLEQVKKWEKQIDKNYKKYIPKMLDKCDLEIVK